MVYVKEGLHSLNGGTSIRRLMALGKLLRSNVLFLSPESTFRASA
jgi:hypothetical protein